MYAASNSLKKAVSLAILFITVVIFTPAVKAQSPFLLGGGLVFGTDIEAIGIQANGVYPLDEERGINLAGDLTLFFPDDAPGVDVSLFTINANGHYIFSTTETLMAYALAGLNIGFFKFEADFGGTGELFGASSVTDTEIGLNAGAGVQFDVGFGYAYGEAKLVLGGFDQLVIGGGVRVPIGGN
ncbi:MAG: hypothetical protein AAF564_10225 [Bacteroidota bacterium]